MAGSLTLGRPELLNPGSLPDALVPVALALAQASRHPLSQSLRRALSATRVKPAELTNIIEIPGQGVSADWQERKVSLGRPLDAARGGDLSVALRVTAEPEVILCFSDALRPGAKRCAEDLAALGLSATLIQDETA